MEEYSEILADTLIPEFTDHRKETHNHMSTIGGHFLGNHVEKQKIKQVLG